jgi:hypothetical protein
MAYFTESQLTQYAVSPEMEKRAGQYLFESKAAAKLSIFLSTAIVTSISPKELYDS